MHGVPAELKPGAQRAGGWKGQALRQDHDPSGLIQQLDEAVGRLKREVTTHLVNVGAGLVEGSHGGVFRRVGWTRFGGDKQLLDARLNLALQFTVSRIAKALRKAHDCRRVKVEPMGQFGAGEECGLVEGVDFDESRTTIADQNLRECLRESIYALELDPPPEGVSESRMVTLDLNPE